MIEMPSPVQDLVVIGKILSVYGVRGEVKVYSFTDPLENLLDYRCWTLRCGGEIRQAELVSGHLYGKVLAAKLKGLNNRDEARFFSGYEICILRDELPALAEDEYYWHELEGLKVINQDGQLFGRIGYLLETGANDVMVVKSCAGSLDDRERLLPYTEYCVLAIDLAAGEMQVDWDADF